MWPSLKVPVKQYFRRHVHAAQSDGIGWRAADPLEGQPQRFGGSFRDRTPCCSHVRLPFLYAGAENEGAVDEPLTPDWPTPRSLRWALGQGDGSGEIAERLWRTPDAKVCLKA